MRLRPVLESFHKAILTFGLPGSYCENQADGEHTGKDIPFSASAFSGGNFFTGETTAVLHDTTPFKQKF